MCIIQHVVHIFLLRLLWKREWTSVFTWWSKKVIWRRSYIKEMHIIIPFWWYSKTYISILGCVSIFSEVMVIRCYLHTLAIFLTYDRAMTTENSVLFMITLFWQKHFFVVLEYVQSRDCIRSYKRILDRYMKKVFQTMGNKSTIFKADTFPQHQLVNSETYNGMYNV